MILELIILKTDEICLKNKFEIYVLRRWSKNDFLLFEN